MDEPAEEEAEEAVKVICCRTIQFERDDEELDEVGFGFGLGFGLGPDCRAEPKEG
jgi:hypothetical protein